MDDDCGTIDGTMVARVHVNGTKASACRIMQYWRSRNARIRFIVMFRSCVHTLCCEWFCLLCVWYKHWCPAMTGHNSRGVVALSLQYDCSASHLCRKCRQEKLVTSTKFTWKKWMIIHESSVTVWKQNVEKLKNVGRSLSESRIKTNNNVNLNLRIRLLSSSFHGWAAFLDCSVSCNRLTLSPTLIKTSMGTNPVRAFSHMTNILCLF